MLKISLLNIAENLTGKTVDYAMAISSMIAVLQDITAIS